MSFSPIWKLEPLTYVEQYAEESPSGFFSSAAHFAAQKKKAEVGQFEVSKTPIFLQRAHFSPVYMTAPVFTIFHTFLVYKQAKHHFSCRKPTSCLCL